jgi:hypothetical protein
MPTRPVEHLPELTEFTEHELQANGYTRRTVSVFDHWLTEDEAGECRLFTYKQAAASGRKATYLAQERRFIAFYKDLFADGAVRRTSVGRCIVGIASHRRWDRKLKRAVIRSLREGGHLDAYIQSMKLRVIGGYDRSDALLFEDDLSLARVQALASAHGLFLI